MEPDFWHQRWGEGRIGFHQQQVSPMLAAHVDALGCGAGDHVLVPLCGKSLDLGWLAARGLRVSGVELSERAASAFFAERDEQPVREQGGTLQRLRHGNVDIHVGDLFELQAAALDAVHGVFDRAALVALPAPMRPAYVRHVCALAGLAPVLLVTLDYVQAQMEGPPFAVADGEVRALYAGLRQVRLLEERDVLADYPRFADLGVEWLTERAYLLSA